MNPPTPKLRELQGKIQKCPPMTMLHTIGNWASWQHPQKGSDTMCHRHRDRGIGQGFSPETPAQQDGPQQCPQEGCDKAFAWNLSTLPYQAPSHPEGRDATTKQGLQRTIWELSYRGNTNTRITRVTSSAALTAKTCTQHRHQDTCCKGQFDGPPP